MECVPPKCKLQKNKCVKPNPYVEALAKCKRDGITIKQCKENYNKILAEKLSCVRYKERFEKDLEDIKDFEDSKDIKDIKDIKYIKDIKDIKDIEDSKDKDINYSYSVINNKKVVKISAAISNKSILKQDRIQFNYDLMKKINKIGIFKVIKKNKYKYGDLQILNKIGSESKYGAAYRVKYKGFDLAAKIMCVNYSNNLEIKLLKKVTKYVMDKKTIHFPIMYFNEIIEKTDEMPNMLLPDAVQYCYNFHLNFNEIFSGDLNMFICQKHNLDIIQNTITQIFFSISNFSYYTNYVHLDTHGGNFLYHNFLSDGYYHYKINGINLYLKNMGYIWVIWDYGFAKKATYRGIFKDYRRVIKRFIPTIFGGWNKIEKYNVNYKMTDSEQFAYNIKQDVDRMKYSYDSKYKNISLLKSEIHKVLLSYLPKSYFVKPDGKIINEGNPFIIE